jgi:histidine ammonia-lyase
MKIKIGHEHLTLAHLRAIARGGVELELADAAIPKIEAAAARVATIRDGNKAVYGVNTGIGKLATTRIPHDQLEALQRNIILSHSVGTGANLGENVVRLTMALKISSLAAGFSGVRKLVIDTLILMHNRGVLPCIPCKGSVGASGDLAPLAHLTGASFGIGHATYQGKVLPAAQAMALADIPMLTLGAKEGIALINGTQVSAALALAGLFATEDAFVAAVLAGSLSVDAAAGSDTPFDPRIQSARLHRGQIEVAAHYRRLLGGSQIRDSHRDNDLRVQDPYALRCQPQVMGAVLEQMRYAAGVFLTEANCVTDNPMVFADTGELLSGGNFHAEPVALAADALAPALAEIGAMSERRIALLMDSQLSGLPPFLVRTSGINSGFMMAQVTAAALVSENKTFAHPPSVDSIPTSANQEDFVSMATFAARRLSDMAENVACVVGIELLASCQGIELRDPLQTSALLNEVIASIRKEVPHYDADRYFAPDIEAAKQWIMRGEAHHWIAGLMPSMA